MNKETTQILEYIKKSGHYLEKIDELREKYSNVKDFSNQFGYLVMEIVQEKQFIHLSRKNIDLPKMVEICF